MDLQALLAQPVNLPCQPRAVALLTAELGQAEPSLRRLNHCMGCDPGLAARLLERANSAAFQLPRQVEGVPQALAVLGAAQVRALLGQVTVGTTSRSVPGVNLQHFWRYSLSTAKLSRLLAGLVQQNQIAAYTAGLLHAVGELALHLAAPAAAQAVSAQAPVLDLRRARVQTRQLGLSYADISAGMAQRWHLPTPIVDALTYQQSPLESEQFEPLAGVVNLASWRARASEAGLGDRELAVTFPGEVGLVLGLDIDMVLQQDPIDWSAQSPPVEEPL